ncbi:MAG: hypothetical protein ACE10A_07845 [Acidiferrobacterales bacterium]
MTAVSAALDILLPEMLAVGLIKAAPDTMMVSWAVVSNSCRPLLRIHAPAALVHLTSMDGGNAEGL